MITLTKGKGKQLRPQLTGAQKQCLASLIKIGDKESWALWDSGSTTTGITPALAQIAGIKVHELLDPHILQLGTVGSRSTIKYGADVNLTLGNTTIPNYVDIANFDRYDMIIGKPFMRTNQVKLDFANNIIEINNEKLL